jgi:guanosine-3',5'-bis(diphosphate) 3'-pyrophosphohydrolase
MNEDSYSRLVSRIKEYNPNCDFGMLEKAYKISKMAHEGQLRVSGEPFILHPIEVAYILADLELDCTAIISAILLR